MTLVLYDMSFCLSIGRLNAGRNSVSQVGWVLWDLPILLVV